MSNPYLGEIRMFAGNFAPRGWALCDGRLLSISGNDALYSLIGTTYGGDGESTFALPDLRGRVPLHRGNGIEPGQLAGAESVTLVPTQFPAHNHTFYASAAQGTSDNPTGNVVAENPLVYVYLQDTPNGALNPASIGPSISNGRPYGSGGPLPHENMQPFLCVNFIIALEGVYPPHN